MKKVAAGLFAGFWISVMLTLTRGGFDHVSWSDFDWTNTIVAVAAMAAILLMIEGLVSLSRKIRP